MAIPYLDNIDIRKKAPNVERDLFVTVADMVAWSENYLPAIFPCYVVETGKRYVYNVSNSVDPVLGKWREDTGGSADLENYYTKAETDELLDEKVDKEEGYGLSKNDYSDTEKQTVADTKDFVNKDIALTTEKQTLTESINELVDKDAELLEKIEDNAEAIEKLQKTPAIAVDEKPVYDGGVITYKQEGETKTTEDADQWFYYSVGTALYQTIFINGIEKTIESGGVDFDEFVKKENVVDTLDSVSTDKPLSANMGKKLNDDLTQGLSEKVSIDQTVENAGKILKVDENGKVTLVEADELGGKAENVSYENENYPLQTNVKKALDKIFERLDYVAPEITSFTVTPPETTYEKGQTVDSLVFDWTYNKEVSSQSLTDVALTDENDRTGTYSDLSTTKTFELSCSDGQNSAKKSISISFKDKIYFGSAAIPAEYNSAFILGLGKNQFGTSHKGKYNVTVGAGEYAFVCCPVSWNMPQVCKIGGFGTDLVNVGNFSFTNASGYASSYKIVRTTQAGLGAIEMLFE